MKLHRPAGNPDNLVLLLFSGLPNWEFSTATAWLKQRKNLKMSTQVPSIIRWKAR